MPTRYNEIDFKLFYLEVKKWIKKQNTPLVFDKTLRKLSRKLSDAPFSILRLYNNFSKKFRYVAITNMMIDEPGANGRIKVALPLVIDHDKAIIQFNHPIALKIMMHVKPQTRSSVCPAALNYMESNFQEKFSVLGRDETPSVVKEYYTMPLFSKECLIDYAARNIEKLSVHKLIIIFIKLTLAMKKIHDSGWAHLDVKPDNIIIHDDEKFLNIDFIDLDHITRIGNLTKKIGTEVYISPELNALQPSQEIPTTAMMDIFSLGLIFNLFVTIDKIGLSRELHEPLRAPVKEELLSLIARMTNETAILRVSIAELLIRLKVISHRLGIVLPPSNTHSTHWEYKTPLENLHFRITDIVPDEYTLLPHPQNPFGTPHRQEKFPLNVLAQQNVNSMEPPVKRTKLF